MSHPSGPDRGPLSRPVSAVLLVAGTLLAFVAGAQPWWRAEGTGVSVTFDGQQTTAGLGQALAVASAAGVLLVLALRARGRRVLGVLLAALGAGMALTGALRQRPSPDAVRSRVREVTLADQFALTGTAWPWLYAVGGGLLLAGAVVLALRARRWPSAADRFARGAPRAVGPEPEAPDDPVALWRALDAGVDPTAGPRDPAEGPGVREGPGRDTMGGS